MTRLLTLSLDYPRRTLALILLLTLAVTAFIPRIHIDTDPENMLPADNAARLFHNAVKHRFDLHDALVVGIVNETHPDGIYNPDSLADLAKLAEAIMPLDGVVSRDLMALSRVDNIEQSAPGTLSFHWLMARPPRDRAQALALKAAVERLPLLYNTLVSGDGRAAALYVPLVSKDRSYAVAERIRALFPDLNPEDAHHVTGLPVAEDQFGSEMFAQMAISAPLAGAMILALMWLTFRSLVLVVAPMLVALATVLITMGGLIAFGFSVHIMSSMIAIFLMPIAVVDSVHLLSEFADRYRPGVEVRPVLAAVFAELGRPMLFTSLTSSAGFLSLMLTPIPPVQIFGAFIGAGILLAYVLTLTLVPAYIRLIDPARLAVLGRHLREDEVAGPTAAVLVRLRRLALGRPRLLLAGFAILLALGVAGLQKIEVNDNPVRWFKAGHQIRVADRALNAHFAGTYDAFLVLEQRSDEAVAAALRHRLDGLRGSGAGAPAPRPFGGGDFGAYLEGEIQRLDDALFDAPAAQQPQLEALLAAFEQAQQQRKRFLDPAVLNYMAGLQAHLQETGLVGKSQSLADLVRTLNRELLSGEARDFRLPDSPPAVAQELLQYQSSHRPQDLWHLVTPDYRAAMVWIQLKSGDNRAVQQLLTAVDRYLDDHPLPPGLSRGWAGKAYLNLVWQESMVTGMLFSLLSAFVIVGLMMLVLFRSLPLALLAMLPLTLTITLIYGLIGWLGKDYDMPIAVLSALTLGLSVDFAIHFIERCRELHRQTGRVDTALARMFEEPGRAIGRNALVIALGFTPLLLAPLVPYITVGLFMAGIMALSALVTLLLLPALIRLGAPWLFGRPQSGTPHPEAHP